MKLPIPDLLETVSLTKMPGVRWSEKGGINVIVCKISQNAGAWLAREFFGIGPKLEGSGLGVSLLFKCVEPTSGLLKVIYRVIVLILIKRDLRAGRTAVLSLFELQL